MSDHIIYRTGAYEEAARRLSDVEQALASAMSSLAQVNTSGEWWGKLNISASVGSGNARNALSGVRSEGKRVQSDMNTTLQGIRLMCRVMDDADRRAGGGAASGKAADRYMSSHAGGGRAFGAGGGGGSRGNEWGTFWQNFDIFKVIGALGTPGKLVSLINSATKCEYWSQAAKLVLVDGLDTAMKVGKCVQMIGDKGIGSAWLVEKTAEGTKYGWGRELLGLKPAPTNVLDDYTGANGSFKAVTKWAGVLLDGVTNYFGNIKEQQASGGTMSNGRVAAETVLETATGLGLNLAVGAGVTAIVATAPVSVPAIAVTALTTGTVALINAGCKTLTGKSTTELVADFVLDEVAPRAAKAVETVKQAYGNVVKTSKAVYEAAKQGAASIVKNIGNAINPFGWRMSTAGVSGR